jgi:hypothetical protein
MRRREFIALVGGLAAVAWPLSVDAQQHSRKIYRIGMLETISAELDAANYDAFRQAKALGLDFPEASLFRADEVIE